MRKEEIIRILEQCDGTILDFPSRGPWGDYKYRGNCSGFVPGFFIYKLGAKNVTEIFAGSGTTSDFCKDFGVNYLGIDLNPNPVRKDIISMNILDDSVDLPDEFYQADMCFLHPPYPSINHVHYSNAMWKDTANVASFDIQEMNYEQGMAAVNHAVMRGYNALPKGSYEVILMGEIHSKGQFHSMFSDLVKPQGFHQAYIKKQYNCTSNRGKMRISGDKVKTAHEMIAVFKKPSGYEIAYLVPREYRLDIRDSQMATWKDVVFNVLNNLGGEASLPEIYAKIEGHKKCETCPTWKATVRKTLQFGPYRNVATGVWAVA